MDPLIAALFGGVDLNTHDFVDRTLSIMRTETDSRKKQIALFGFLTDKRTDETVDYEFIRLLQEALENNTAKSELENIIWCLSSRDLKLTRDENISDLSNNIKIGKAIGDIGQRFTGKIDEYIIFKIAAASYKRMGMAKEAAGLEEIAERLRK